MLLSAVSVLVVSQSSSEIPEGLMNNPVFICPKITRYFCQILMKLAFSRQILEKLSNTKFHENMFSGEPSCSMRTDGQIDITKLIIVFCQFSDATKNYSDCNRFEI